MLIVGNVLYRMLTIEEYCAEHKVTHKARLAELGIQFWDFYTAKKKYREEDSMDTEPGQFIQLSSSRCVPGSNHLPERKAI